MICAEAENSPTEPVNVAANVTLRTTAAREIPRGRPGRPRRLLPVTPIIGIPARAALLGPPVHDMTPPPVNAAWTVRRTRFARFPWRCLGTVPPLPAISHSPDLSGRCFPAVG